MELVQGNKSLAIVISITVLIGLFLVMLTNEYNYLYIMITALVIEGIIFDKERKKNLWKFFLSYLVLLLVVYLLFILI